VIAARDGREAVDLEARQQGPRHLLVTDVVMPGLDGRAVADALCPRRPEMRVLYVSGHAEEAIVKRGVLEPGIEFLPKPFKASSLLARVREVLDAPGPTSSSSGPAGMRLGELAAGVSAIDLQHRQFLTNVALLHEAVRKGNLSRATDILEFLETYAREHFEAEERCMESAEYPKLALHREAHLAFVVELGRRKAEFDAKQSMASTMTELCDSADRVAQRPRARGRHGDG